MTYNSLVGPKGSTGSIMGWVNYSKLDVGTVVDEAQSLIYSMLRVREMRSTWTFGIDAGASNTALPDRFLDPIGKLFDTTNGGELTQKLETDVLGRRVYTPVAGAFGSNPFTTQAPPSQNVNANLANHPFTHSSIITISGSNSPIDGITVNGAFPIRQIVDASNFMFNADAFATVGGVNGGGAAASYTGNVLILGYPSCWGIFDERLNFDVAFDIPIAFRLLYYRSPLLLSATNQTNFLTNRYPMLMRKACQAAAADFMKDDTEYKKGVEGLSALIQSTAAESDLSYRGAEFGTDTP